MLPAKFRHMMDQLQAIAEVVEHRITRWGEQGGDVRQRPSSGWMS
jgi:hypothetical protein